MRAANLAHGVIDTLTGADVLEFGSEAEWMAHLAALGLTELRVAPDPVRAASEGAAHGARSAPRIGSASAVILSDDAGQFRSATMLCAGFTRSALSTSSFPPTTGSAAPSKSPGG